MAATVVVGLTAVGRNSHEGSAVVVVMVVVGLAEVVIATEAVAEDCARSALRWGPVASSVIAGE